MKTYWTKSGSKIIRIISGRSNVFLLTNGDTKILIDTAVPRLWNKIRKRLEKQGMDRIDYLILTHAHFDHAGNAHRIKEKYRAKVLIHRDEADLLINGTNRIPKGTAPFTRCVTNLLRKRSLSMFNYEPCQYDGIIDALFDLNDRGMNSYIMHTPGHTAGSISIIVDDEIALVGDTMFGVIRGSVFPPYADDVKKMVHSWGQLLDTGCSIFLPSHGSANSRSLVLKDYNRRIKGYSRLN